MSELATLDRISQRLSDGVNALTRRFRGSVDLVWFMPGIRDMLSTGLGRKPLEQRLTAVTASLEMMPMESQSAIELNALRGLLFEAERALAGDDRVESDMEKLRSLAVLSEPSLEPPSPEQLRGSFLAEFMNDAVRDFSLEPVRAMMGERFNRAVPGLREPIEEMARLAGFFSAERPTSLRGAIERAGRDLPTLTIGLISGPVSGRIVEDLLGDAGIAALAQGVLDGKVARMMASLEEDEFARPEGMTLVLPPPEIAMMQAAMTSRERRINPGASVRPGAPPPGGGVPFATG